MNKILKKLLPIVTLMTVFVNSIALSFYGDISVTDNMINIKCAFLSGYSEQYATIIQFKQGKTEADLPNAADIEAVADHVAAVPVDENGGIDYSYKSNVSGERLLYVKYANETIKKIIDPSVDSSVEIETNIYVSTDGNDNNSGTKDMPLATLNGAREKLRELSHIVPINVIFRGGTYEFDESVVFDKNDSGTLDTPITYKAYEDEKVIFDGSKSLDISNLNEITDSSILSRIHKDAVGKVREMDLIREGITYEMLSPMLLSGRTSPKINLFLNDNMQTLAKWPNTGYATIGTVVEQGGITSIGDSADIGGTFKYFEDEPSNWGEAADLMIKGLLGTDWHEEYSKVASINTADKTIQLTNSTAYGINEGFMWSAVNLLEEIDTPGEWYIDLSSMKLYYYPPEDIKADDSLKLTAFADDFIIINNCSYINIENITFQNNGYDNGITSRFENGGNGVLLKNVNNINISGCVFNNIGKNGITVKGENVVIEDCDIKNLGACGIRVYSSGNRQNLTSSGIVIKNNEIQNASLIAADGSFGGIYIDSSVGVDIENNAIHNMPIHAIRYGGNEHLIRYNEIYDVMNKVADAGAIYAGRNWSEYGTVIEYNYFHDLGPDYKRPGSYRVNAVFFDDLHSGNTVRNNIIYFGNKNTSGGIKIGGGRDNVVENNIIINASSAIVGEDRSSTSGLSVKTWEQYSSLEEVPYTEEPFISRYPQMSTIYSDIETDGAFIPRNTIKGNIYCDTERNSFLSDFQKYNNISDYDMGSNYDIFVDSDNNDFRITKTALEESGISDFALSEDFNLNLIGMQKNRINSVQVKSGNTVVDSLTGFQGQATVTVDMVNKSGQDINAMIFVALKDADGKLINCGLVNDWINMSVDLQSFDIPIEIHDPITTETLEVYVWSKGLMTPFVNRYIIN